MPRRTNLPTLRRTQRTVPLRFDDAPTAGSANPVKSGGVKTALDAKADDADLAAIAKSGKLADATEDATHRVVTDEEKAAWNAAAEKEIPTKTSDLTNDGENGTDKFATESYVNQKTSQIYRYKGSVATYNDLPTTHDVGDVYNVVAAYGDYPAGTNFAWNGTEWDALGGSIDTVRRRAHGRERKSRQVGRRKNRS